MEMWLTIICAFLFAICVVMAVAWWLLRMQSRRAIEDAEKRIAEAERAATKATLESKRLLSYAAIPDAERHARELIDKATQELQNANAKAVEIRNQAAAELVRATEQRAAALASADASAQQVRSRAEAELQRAREQAAAAIASAEARAQQIAGQALEAMRNAELYKQTARAMENKLQGYGQEYLFPGASLLDNLAADFAHKDAGQRLIRARSHTKALIKSGVASKCEYVEENRRTTAEAFVLDAFNGKVDSVLSRARHDNFGVLLQELQDAFAIVNFHGKAFRDARITQEYMDARSEELRWAVVVHELKLKEQAEQRRIREQIRDEEKARREYEKAMRDAAKEEETLKKALLLAQQQVLQATEAQRAQYEQQLATLSTKLKEAEDRNRRAISMAQQTKRGHVYIISNVGSLGDDVIKIGVTRRLDPIDRVYELGDASVPFDFDVHAFIFSDDAPALEYRLHQHFLLHQVNKVNHRKEFFRASLAEIRKEIENMGIEAQWTMAAEAKEYRDTLNIEARIAIDPVAREAWLKRQLELDPTDVPVDSVSVTLIDNEASSTT